MANLFPRNDEAFATSLGNFITVAQANLTTLGFQAADIAPLSAAKTDLEAKIADSYAKQEAAKASTAAKAISRDSADDVLRVAVRKVCAKEDVPASLLVELGIKVRDPQPTPVPITTPSALVVSPSADGTNKLKWKGNGNGKNATYVVEAKVGDAADFTFVDVTTKCSFLHKAQKPGVKVVYRVKAKRSGRESPYGNTATAYG